MTGLLLFITIYKLVEICSGRHLSQTEVSKKNTVRVHQPIMFVAIPFKVVDQVNVIVNLDGFCQCFIREAMSLKIYQQCSYVTLPQRLTPTKIQKKEHTFFLHFFEVPGRRHKMQYLNVISSYENELWLGFYFGLFAVNTENCANLVDIYDSEAMWQFYAKYLRKHEMSLASGGYLNTILIDREVYIPLEEKIGIVNTMFKETISRTSSRDLSFTKFSVAWASDYYTCFKEVETNGYWSLILFLIASVLAFEKNLGHENKTA